MSKSRLTAAVQAAIALDAKTRNKLPTSALVSDDGVTATFRTTVPRSSVSYQNTASVVSKRTPKSRWLGSLP